MNCDKKTSVAVVGAGISGMTVARLLKDKADVTVYEQESKPGGLIKCDRVDGSLFHTCGGHVFNTKRKDVLDFFHAFFDVENDFLKAERNSAVIFDDSLTVPYPVENHAYCFDDKTLDSIISDVILSANDKSTPENFEQFLKKQFGRTLYDIYFGPYNSKIWRRSLSSVPLSWLEGKLPMPSPQEIIFNNIRKVQEKKFVHSSFWYEKVNGSQFLADRFAEGLDIRYSTPVKTIERSDGLWLVNGTEYDTVVFCGNIRMLPDMLHDSSVSRLLKDVTNLEYHGTTSVFCEIEPNPYSWIYLPDPEYDAHRIICTGNFSPTNNAPGHMTGTVEFTDRISEEEIKKQLAGIPLSPRYITHKYNQYTYPVQDNNTRAYIGEIKSALSKKSFYLTGRFADWEYYNMDVAIGAALDLVKSLDII